MKAKDQQRLHREALDTAQAFGCAMCGGNVTEILHHVTGYNPTVVDAGVVSLKPWAKFVLLTNGTFQDRAAAVCDKCYPKLATPDGINELTQKVNG